MKSVVLCCSKRFKDEIAAIAKDLEERGIVVFEPNFKEPLFEDEQVVSPHMTHMLFKGLTLEHFEWVRKADICYIYNPGGYAGVSVTMEMAFAQALGKPIYALEPKTGDPCRDTLIDKVVPTVDELAKLLGADVAHYVPTSKSPTIHQIPHSQNSA